MVTFDMGLQRCTVPSFTGRVLHMNVEEVWSRDTTVQLNKGARHTQSLLTKAVFPSTTSTVMSPTSSSVGLQAHSCTGERTCSHKHLHSFASARQQLPRYQHLKRVCELVALCRRSRSFFITLPNKWSLNDCSCE